MTQSRLRILALALALPFLLPAMYAVEQPYQAGTVIDVEQKSRSIVLYYLVNTPVTREEPYYEVSVQLKNTIYAGQYTPRHAADTLPEDWKAGAEVQARIDGHHLLLRSRDGVEVQFVIIKHKDVAPEPAATH